MMDSNDGWGSGDELDGECAPTQLVPATQQFCPRDGFKL